MTQADSSHLSQREPLSQGHNSEEGSTSSEIRVPMDDETPFFPVIEKVTFKSLEPVPEHEAWHLSLPVARLVSLVSLGAMVLWPLSGCSSTGDSNLPCPVPTSGSSGKPVANGTPTIKCTTHNGSHYIWFPSHGGWVPSEDGIHPDPNAHGVGEDTGHGGVGDGSDGSGHGGSDGG